MSRIVKVRFTMISKALSISIMMCFDILSRLVVHFFALARGATRTIEYEMSDDTGNLILSIVSFFQRSYRKA